MLRGEVRDIGVSLPHAANGGFVSVISGAPASGFGRVSTVVNREFGMLYELLLDITTSWDATAEVR